MLIVSHPENLQLKEFNIQLREHYLINKEIKHKHTYLLLINKPIKIKEYIHTLLIKELYIQI